jgi:hypothetical protein
MKHDEHEEHDDYVAFVKTYNYGKYLKNGSLKTKIDMEESVYSGDLFDLYSWLRNTCIPFNKWKKYPGVNNIKYINIVPDFLRNYEEYKKGIEKIDYSDMLQIVIDKHILLDTPILMADEFQDFTAQMYKVFEMWVPACESVLIAADPNQSIYEIFGGCPDHYHHFEATEIVKDETFRLPEQIKNFSHKILKYGGMTAPETKARQVASRTIYGVRYDCTLPVYENEFHLVRCNYQAHAIALSLAREGRVFGGLRGWTEDEVSAANTIISIRQGKAISLDQMDILINLFSSKMLGIRCGQEDFVGSLGQKDAHQLDIETAILNCKILNIINSTDPTKGMIRNSKLFKVKINGIKNRLNLITLQ